MKILNTNCRCFPLSTTPNRIITIAVLTEDACGMQAVYMGCAPEDSDYHSEAVSYDIAHHGFKLSIAEAKAHFPNLDPQKYRT